jgi:hypothetical protein
LEIRLTVIAWDGETLAADRQATSGGFKSLSFPKIHRLDDGSLVAPCGASPMGVAMIAWARAGFPPDKFPNAGRSDTQNMCWLAVIKPDGQVWEYQDLPVPFMRPGTKMAWGSGREAAMGAMLAGADAREAVLIASEIDDGCGFGVQVEPLRFSRDPGGEGG